jgi:hypothetical protein
MGVPAHTRNDFLFGHYRSIYKWDWDNPLETWVEERIEANSGQCPWSGSGPVVFDKLSKYFDTNIYNGSYLGDGQVPPGAWGLSECTNYQFLSLSTVFDCFGSLYQFPHPAKEHTSLLFSSVPDGFKVYFDGSNYGVTHLARDSYTRYVGGRYGFSGPSIDSTITTDDLNVFEDYAEITIPRTINYASGLINYFFRGRLSVEPNCLDGNDVQLIITNESSNSGVQQTLKGGTFELYWDDEDGERNEVTDFTVDGWGPSSTLGYGQSVTGQFACPEYEAEEYTLVYKGAISENPADSDPDDLDTIAICKVETPENCCIVDCSPPGSFTLSFSDIMECSEQCECFEGGYEVWPSNLNSQNIICPYRYETKGFNFFTGWANGWSFNITTPYYPPYCNKRIWVSVSYEDVCYTDEAFGVCLAFGGYIEDFSQSQQANNRLLEGDCCSFNDDWFTFGNEEGDALVTGYGGTCTLICNP